MTDCEWCGSSRHTSDKCPTYNLVGALTGEGYDPEVLPDVVLVGKIEDLDTMIGIGHTLQHDHKNIPEEEKQ